MHVAIVVSLLVFLDLALATEVPSISSNRDSDKDFVTPVNISDGCCAKGSEIIVSVLNIGETGSRRLGLSDMVVFVDDVDVCILRSGSLNVGSP